VLTHGSRQLRSWLIFDVSQIQDVATDAKIREIALSYIDKAVVKGKAWPSTRVGELHPSLVSHLPLDASELVIATAYFSDESWYAFTTRRIVSRFGGALHQFDPSRGFRDDFGNFKGYAGWPDSQEIVARGRQVGAVAREVATISAVDGSATIRFEYETWEASMIPIYAAGYWMIKHPVIDKLMTISEREAHRAKNG
jgi:hypothetical protein